MDPSPDRQGNPGGEHDSLDRWEDEAVDGEAAVPENGEEDNYRERGQAMRLDSKPAAASALDADGGSDQ